MTQAGFRSGSFARRGFGPDDLRKINPRLIYVEANAYGFQGPWAERRGWEQLAQAATGLAALHSAKLGSRRMPREARITVVDTLAGADAVFTMLPAGADVKTRTFKTPVADRSIRRTAPRSILVAVN